MSVRAVDTWLKQTRRDYILSTFFIFCRDTRIIDPIYDKPHKEMCDELEFCAPSFGADDPAQKKELYLAPRRTYKTSLVVAFICYCILKWPNIRIGLGRATHKMAKGLLFEVQEKLTRNPIILEVFGDLSKNAPIWNEEQIVVNTRTAIYHEPTVDTFGLGTSLTGQHLDLILGDDFVHESNYQSVAAFEAGKISIQSFLPVLEPHGSIIITGTRWAANDLYGWLMDMDDRLEQAATDEWQEGMPLPVTARQWRTYIRSAFDGEGNLFFPAVITEKFLEQMRKSLTSKLFSALYLNQAHEEGLQVFPSIIQRSFDYFANPYPVVVWEDERSREVVNLPVYVTMTIDPALMSNPTNDQMGVVINATDFDDIWWVLHAEGFRKVPSQQASRVLYLIRSYLPSVVVQESAGADAEFTARLALGIAEINDDLPQDRQIKLIGYSVLRDEAAGKRGKAQRIEALEPRNREGKLILRRGHTGDLYRQLNTWPAVPNNLDDVADALAMQRKVARPASAAAIRESFDALEAEEERISWGPTGKPAAQTAAARVLGRAIAQVGSNTQRTA